MKIVKLPKYNIYVDKSFSNYDDFLFEKNKGAKVFIVTDSNVSLLYKKKLEEKISKSQLFWYVLNPGDDSKNIDNVLKIIGFLFKNDAKRDDILISFGGGMVTDITGLVASIYMRGINLVHIPTTIIAQIDSSIGGKTSINYLNFKNVIGTFYDPKIVICETNFLKSLPKKEVINGLGELIKIGFIGDENIIREIELNQKNLLSPSTIKKAIDVKKEYVADDYFDKSKRNILNFGHTIGHAIEASSNFTISHGEAVIIGMIKALEIGISLKITNPQVLDRLKNLLNLIQYEAPNVEFQKYEKFLYKDKKSVSDSVRFVILEDILKPRIEILTWERLKHELANK